MQHPGIPHDERVVGQEWLRVVVRPLTEFIAELKEVK